jgi:hypothetical protein
VEVVVRIALLFFLIQFLVVMTIMIAALLLARPDVPVLGRESGRAAIRRSHAFVIRLPSYVLRSLLHLAHCMHLRSVH